MTFYTFANPRYLSYMPPASCFEHFLAGPSPRAVDRNLVKRRVRDVFRKNKAAWPKDMDFIVHCTELTLRAPYDELKVGSSIFAASSIIFVSGVVNYGVIEAMDLRNVSHHTFFLYFLIYQRFQMINQYWHQPEHLAPWGAPP